ncbi:MULTISPECIES: acyl carrier protein [Streptomyces]|uniref:Acyl carrier protein n=2 Tax=Streptomyces rimosus subsp. rimosus TaxID=132474 RepID=L8EXT5_STRR1|nr:MULTISPECIES: acyl carrier protein [Streptomyces]KOG68734.1 acyl carrier protein [Kitasatospora aureofaciens]MYT47447.1 acyl carrier protein [Streptomyces sp. SID5471]KEF07892.1 acyl carrier protein [Streptomyces rimosus]KEF21138.1 acyl carrier protein [Streptomyces rimosus]KOT41118.1 acyl carrier protein [Streptomyces sp. NRRL WC-3701]
MSQTAESTAQDQTITAVREALGDVLQRELPDLGPDAKLFDDYGLDSTGVLDLLMRLEEVFDVEFDTEELEMSHFATVRTLADYVAAAR